MVNNYDRFESLAPTLIPVRHKRKVPFDPDIEVDLAYREKILQIRQLDFELNRFILSAKDYFDLVLEAYSSNIHWSTKIEGNPLTEQEVRTIAIDTFNRKKTEKPSGPKQEVINHLNSFFFEDEFNLPWTSKTICGLHGYLLEGTQDDDEGIGAYRTTEAVIRNRGEDIFIPAPLVHIKEEMDSLLEWLNRKGAAYDPIVTATVFFHEFESIHPFADGNGRTGRTLFHILLQKLGLKNSKLCKIEHALLSKPSIYYGLLAYTDDKGSYKELIDFVSSAMIDSYRSAYDELRGKDLLSSGLDETSIRILRMAKESGREFTVSEATSWVSGRSEQTVGNKLKELVDIGALQKTGRTTATRFILNDPLREFRKQFVETTR